MPAVQNIEQAFLSEKLVNLSKLEADQLPVNIDAR